MQRFGREGYRAISEARREAGHSVVSSNTRSYPAEDVCTNVLDNSLERQALQHEGSSMLSAQNNLRWALIHSRREPKTGLRICSKNSWAQSVESLFSTVKNFAKLYRRTDVIRYYW